MPEQPEGLPVWQGIIAPQEKAEEPGTEVATSAAPTLHTTETLTPAQRIRQMARERAAQKNHHQNDSGIEGVK